MEHNKKKAATLRSVADYVGLATGTVSLVLNRSPQATSIPQRTKDRIFAAARYLNYKPNLFARALRSGPLGRTWHQGEDIDALAGAVVFVSGKNVQRAMTAMQQAGLRIPEDVLVMGVDGFAPQTALHPRLRPDRFASAAQFQPRGTCASATRFQRA